MKSNFKNTEIKELYLIHIDNIQWALEQANADIENLYSEIMKSPSIEKVKSLTSVIRNVEDYINTHEFNIHGFLTLGLGLHLSKKEATQLLEIDKLILKYRDSWIAKTQDIYNKIM